jgi:hypothetical protein
MRHQTFGVLTAGAVLSAAVLFAQPATAMPVGNLATAAGQLSNTQDVAWVCGPFRCWWAPRYRYYAPVVVVPRAYYGYRPVYRGYRPYYGYRVVRPAWGVRRGYWGRRW